MQWQKIFEYRVDMFIYAINAVLAPIVGFMIWLAASSSGASLVFSRNEIIVYFIMVLLINSLTFSWHAWFLAEDIKWGRINKNLLKPLPFLSEYIISSAVQRFFRSFFVIGSLAIIYWLITGNFDINFGIEKILLFLISLIMAVIIAFNIESICGILAFWTTDVDFVIGFVNLLNNLFSGRVIPLLFLPFFLKDLAILMPFRYTIAFPAEIAIGKLNQHELIFGLIIQVIWLVISFLIYKLLINKGIKAYSAYGS